MEESLEVTKRTKKRRPSFGQRLWRFVKRLLCFILVTAVLLVGTLYGVMYILAKGPSETARDLFVMSVRETSAIGFLANLFFTDEEIAQIEKGKAPEAYAETDTSLITISQPEQNADGPVADAWGLIDEDGDGIIIDPIKGPGYTGYMMVVLDPSRVIMGSVPESYYIRGYTVEEMVAHFDAVAGINAGGFVDPDGQGNGSIPDTLTVVDGKIYMGGIGNGFVGFDADHIMHVGCNNEQEILDAGIQYGVCFGPVLIQNGEPCELEYHGGINPRTAIGQRSDGAVLMLVIDGRQVASIGATYVDETEIMMRYGAVNACNLDGGSSSLMWFDGGYVNNCASVIGIRPVPTSFLVLKAGEGENG